MYNLVHYTLTAVVSAYYSDLKCYTHKINTKNRCNHRSALMHSHLYTQSCVYVDDDFSVVIDMDVLTHIYDLILHLKS